MERYQLLPHLMNNGNQHEERDASIIDYPSYYLVHA